MFPFIQAKKKRATCNPLGGACIHDCVYCWAKTLIKRYDFKKYRGLPKIYVGELKDYEPEDFIFVQDMSDLFANNVPGIIIKKILSWIESQPQVKFLLLTKNPNRYQWFIEDFPSNVTLGATIETDKIVFLKYSKDSKYYHYRRVSKAHEHPISRLLSMRLLKTYYKVKNPLFISIEPILEFSSDFATHLKEIEPWGIAVGYDNYNFKLPEPTLADTKKLIGDLEKFTIGFPKTIRKAWWE
jgi:hypothetical protein